MIGVRLRSVVVAAALLAAPAALAQVSDPKPTGAPQRWITNADYPRSAAGQGGLVHFRLEIDAKGKVIDCAVTQSSGTPILDETTCARMKSRARFIPAQDAEGNKVPGSWSSRFRWIPPN